MRPSRRTICVDKIGMLNQVSSGSGVLRTVFNGVLGYSNSKPIVLMSHGSSDADARLTLLKLAARKADVSDPSRRDPSRHD